MANPSDLCCWLRHNVNDLRMEPDLVTEAPGPAVRYRWHRLVTLKGIQYGIGVDLHPGPALGEIWMYGHEAKDVRLYPRRAPMVPYAIRTRLRTILVAHLIDRDQGWGRGAILFGHEPTADAGA